MDSDVLIQVQIVDKMMIMVHLTVTLVDGPVAACSAHDLAAWSIDVFCVIVTLFAILRT